MTLRQARALAALMLGVREHDRLPAAEEVEDGCYSGGSLSGDRIVSSAHGVAERMNMLQLLRHANAASASRCLNALVRQGFAARVFRPDLQSPRYVPTQAGAEEYKRILAQPKGT